MALTQEEIRIRAGLDYSTVTAGLADIRGQVFRLANDIPKKLTGILKANVYAAAGSLISEVLPTWDEIWSRVYGVDKETLEKMTESLGRIGKLRSAMIDAQKSLARLKKDSAYSGADNVGKFKMLVMDQMALEKEESEIRKTIKTREEYLKFTKEFHKGQIMPEDIRQSREEQISHLAEDRKKLAETQGELIRLSDKRLALSKQMSPEQTRTTLHNLLNETKNTVLKERLNAEKAEFELRFNPNTDREQNIAALETAKRRIGEIVAARKLSSLDFANTLPDVGIFGAVKSSLLAAQTEAMKQTIQRVAVVEVQD